MPSCSELRARARKALGGNIFAENWIWGLLLYLVATVIIGVTGMFVVGIILIGPVELGMAFYMIRMARGTRPEFADPFRKAAEDMPGSIVTGLLVTLYTFLWSLLFIIPGFIKSYSYAMTYYIRVDHPEYTATQCIDESRRMMDGHKMKLFLLDLSFIGWLIVGSLCFGVGTLWVYVYMTQARAQFYEELKNGDTVVIPPAADAQA